MTLKLNGYSTAQFGKCHEVPVWQSSPMGPFDAWPSGGGGFETFYGFIGGENNQWDPALYDGTTPVEPPATAEEGYHLTEDLADHAVDWVRQQKALMPDKPFFVYFAPGATHAPHHVPKEWADKYEGQFADGLGRAARARRSPGRRSSASSPRTPSSPPATTRSRRGTTCPTSSSRCSSARWRSTPGSSSTPTTTSAGSSTPSRTSASSTTRSSTTSSATTARRPRARSTARSTRWPTSTAWPRSRRPSSWSARWTSSARPPRTTTTPSAGRGR